MSEQTSMNGGTRDVTRRELLGGGLALGAMVMVGGGCEGTRRAGSALPGPRWPSVGGSAPIVERPPVRRPGGGTDLAGLPEGVTPRSQWTRAGLARPSEANPMGGINRITVHHDAIPSGDLRSSAQVASRIESIRNSHIGRGWADIGYHYIIDPSGRVWEGRSLRYQGAHVQDNNPNNIGVMVMGNFDQQAPTPQALAALDRFVASQMARFGVGLGRVYTHQELKPTACPGTSLQRYMVQTRGGGGRLAAVARGGRGLG